MFGSDRVLFICMVPAVFIYVSIDSLTRVHRLIWIEGRFDSPIDGGRTCR